MCLTYIRISYARTSLPTSENRVEKYVQKMRITLENLYLFMRMVRKKITHEKHAENTCYNKRKSCEKKMLLQMKIVQEWLFLQMRIVRYPCT